MPRVPFRLVSVLLPAALLGGCDLDDIFGTGQGPTAEATTPGGIQQGEVTIVYTLSHASVTTAEINPKYSTNGGLSFVLATEGSGGSGTTNLSVSPGGDVHTFVWDSAADLGDARIEDVRFRISPVGGKSDTTNGFVVHNSVFMVMSHDAQDGKLSLYELDLLDGDPGLLDLVDTGGEWSWDVIFVEGFFYVANSGTNTVGAFELDEAAGELLAVGGSPWSTGGIEPTYLASDGDHLFVSNVTSETITVFDIQSGGDLSLNSGSGVSVAGCRSLVVRATRLYVASETNAEIVLFDIDSGGGLIPNAFSPMTDVGMSSPRATALLGSYLYVANFDVATVHAFRFLGGGELMAVAGSPFSFTDAGVEAIHVHQGDRLFLAGGAAQSFTSMGVDTTGVATEDAGSPVSAAGPVNAVTGDGDIVVAGTTTAETLESYSVDAGGALTAVTGSPFAANGDVAAMAVSD